MGISDEFVDHVVEQFSGWGEVSVRRMFGGAGLYRDGIMFAVVAEDVAYLKVDDSNRDDFLRAGSAPSGRARLLRMTGVLGIGLLNGWLRGE